MHIAYIDPGSGSYLIQVIIAAILGVAFYFKTAWNWIKSFFVRNPKKPNSDQNESSD
ncbi:MAG: hypothetical protein ACK55K_03580 [Bacteroidota bacterium]|jgi:hypothetical protein